MADKNKPDPSEEELVKARAVELEKSNDRLEREIAERVGIEQRLTRINEVFLSFGADPLENINRLTALCGEILNATCALYNRLDDGLLCSWGQWNTPPGYNPVDKPEGHICYQFRRKTAKGTTVSGVPDLYELIQIQD